MAGVTSSLGPVRELLDLASAPGHLIRRAQQMHTGYWAEEVGDRITGPQFGVLVSLAGSPGVSQTRLGELASMDKNTTTAILGRLERDSWVERVRDPADGRRRLLRLTASAAAQLPELGRAAARVQERLIEPLSPDERSVFLARLAKVALRQREASTATVALAEPARSMAVTPGYLIRRAQQVHTELWNGELAGEPTPPQYAALVAVAQGGRIDQRQLGELASLDRSSAAEVVTRLERRGWLVRTADPRDRRRSLLELTGPARLALRHLAPAVAGIQQRLLEPLPVGERKPFMRQFTCVAYRDAQPAKAKPSPEPHRG